MNAEIHFFHSGNGDTILIRGGDEWGLVDANFVKYLGVRDRVEQLLQGVEKLRFVCITHFDLDHIRGLADFLRDRFSNEDGKGNRIWNVEQLILPLSPVNLKILDKLSQAGEAYAKQQAKSLDKEAGFSREARDLLKMLFGMAANTRQNPGGGTCLPELLNLRPGAHVFGPPGRPQIVGMGPWRIVCLGPHSDTAELFGRQVENAFGAGLPLRDLFTRIQQNDVSRVLALLHHEIGATVLLTGDSTQKELRASLLQWDRLNRLAESVDPSFSFVKISHHGASSCHVPQLYRQYCDSGSTRAVICARDDGEHPHQDVIKELRANRIDYCVTGAIGPSTPRSIMPGVPMGAPLVDQDPSDVVLKIRRPTTQLTGGHMGQ